MWCARGNLNDEHVIGKQFVKRLNVQYPIYMHWAGWVGSAKNTIRVVLKNRVCKKCNGGWMRDLDDEIAALLGDSMSDGKKVILGRRDQKRVATW